MDKRNHPLSLLSTIDFEMANFEFSNYSVVYMFLMYQLGDDLHTHGAILSNVRPLYISNLRENSIKFQID